MLGRIRFGVYELDREAMELRKHGALIRLQEQPLQVLTALVERPGEIVTREELQERIWGKDTFVDFDQSLNKAVNRLREALNDDPAQPRYVETVPRRGYRFVAPVTGIAGPEEPGPTGSVSPALVPGSAKPESNRRRQIIILTGLTAAAVLITLGVWTVLSLKRLTKPTTQEARHITADGFAPALSRDGQMLAYASTASTGPPHLWVQQTAGGEPTRVTPGSELDMEPGFSPDSTQIVFYSERVRRRNLSGPNVVWRSSTRGPGSRYGRSPFFTARRQHPVLERSGSVRGIRRRRPTDRPRPQPGFSRGFFAFLEPQWRRDSVLWGPEKRSK
jgi:DNA-binding winged helix-turn-helix (wHTH) protein